MDKLCEAINETIREHQAVFGASLGEVVNALTLLQAYYVREAIKEIKTEE